MARKTARAVAAPSGARPPRQPTLFPKPAPEAEPKLTAAQWRAMAADLEATAHQRAREDRFFRYLMGLAAHYAEQARRAQAGMELLPRPSLAQLLREMAHADEQGTASMEPIAVEARKRELREQLARRQDLA